MFKNEYQGGPSVEVFSAQGSNPAANWKLAGAPAIKRVFSSDVKSHVYNVEGGTTVKMSLPKDDTKTLCLTQRFFVLQIFVPQGQPFAIELGVSDLGGSRRRLFLSSAHTEVTVTPLHARIPLAPLRRGVWLNLALDVASLVADSFRGQTYRAVETIVIAANCRLRKIFTMKNQPPDDDYPGGGPSTATVEVVPRAYALHPDVHVATVVLTMHRIHEACARGPDGARKPSLVSPDDHHSRGTPTDDPLMLSSASQGSMAARKPLKGAPSSATASSSAAAREASRTAHAAGKDSVDQGSAGASVTAQQRSSRLAQARARSRESLANAAAHRSTSATSSNGDLQEIVIPNGATTASSAAAGGAGAKRPTSARRLSDAGKNGKRSSSPSKAVSGATAADDGPLPSASVFASRGSNNGMRRSVTSSQRGSGDSGRSAASRSSGGAAVAKGAGPDEDRGSVYLYSSHPHAPPPRNISPGTRQASIEGRSRSRPPSESLEDGVGMRRDLDDNDFSAGSGDETRASRDSGISVATNAGGTATASAHGQPQAQAQPLHMQKAARGKTPTQRDARVLVDESCSPIPSRTQGASGAGASKKYDAFRYQSNPNPALKSAAGNGFPSGRSSRQQARPSSKASIASVASYVPQRDNDDGDQYDSDGGLRASFFAGSSVASSMALNGSHGSLGNALLAGHLPRAGRLAPKSRGAANESRASHRSSRTNASSDEDGGDGRTSRDDDETGHFFENSPLVTLNDHGDDEWSHRRHHMASGPAHTDDGDYGDGDTERGDGSFSPPVVPPSARLQSQHSIYGDEDEHQRSLGHSGKLSNFGGGDGGEGSSEEELDLLYDPMLNCYYDPRTNKYYELA